MEMGMCNGVCHRLCKLRQADIVACLQTPDDNFKRCGNFAASFIIWMAIFLIESGMLSLCAP
jgi:hypothetical protein